MNISDWANATAGTAATHCNALRKCKNCVFYKVDTLFAGKGLCQKYHIDDRETNDRCDQWKSMYYETTWTAVLSTTTTATTATT